MTATNTEPSNDVVVAEIVTEQTLDAQVAEMRIEVARMSEILNNQVTLLGAIHDALAPMLEKMSNNPMFRMLFPGE